MSAIKDFSDKVQESFGKVNTAITGIQGDIASLNDKITALQNSVGQITPEDQALLDAIQSQGADIATKLGAIDDLTPPVAPPA